MNSRRNQRGMTMWGMIFVLGVLGFTMFLAFKLFPPYMADFKVKGAFESLERQGGLGSMTKQDIMTSLYKRFDVDNIDHISLDKELVVENRGTVNIIRLDYEVEVPVAGNLYILLKFNHLRQARAGG